jgi:hypothetical protein
MQRMRHLVNGLEHDAGPLPFPVQAARKCRSQAVSGPADDALDALETMSRRMEDLARAFGCYFDDADDQPPRAA